MDNKDKKGLNADILADAKKLHPSKFPPMHPPTMHEHSDNRVRATIIAKAAPSEDAVNYAEILAAWQGIHPNDMPRAIAEANRVWDKHCAEERSKDTSRPKWEYLTHEGEYTEEELDMQGAVGWELVTYTGSLSHEDSAQRYIFKRQLI